MRTSWALALLLPLAATTCGEPSFPCTRYCWSHRQAVPDVTDEEMTGVPDGRFDIQCTRFIDFQDWYPSLPSLGWYSAEQCLEAGDHQVIAETVASIQDPMVDAGLACDVTDLQVYTDFVNALATQSRDACVAHLTCDGAPAGCGIDPALAGNQACTVETAEILCDQVVLDPALAALNDLSNGPGAAQPKRDGTVTEYVAEPQDCEPLLLDTDGTPSCAEGAGGDGVDDTAGTTGEEGRSGPFGDVDSLVSCTTATVCTVEPQLLVNIQRNFGVFIDEGVWLEHVDIPGLGRGVQLSGLDRGEASTELLDAFGIENGDVITHVDGVSLASTVGIEQMLTALPTATSWSLTVLRWTGSTWATLGYTVTLAP